MKTLLFFTPMTRRQDDPSCTSLRWPGRTGGHRRPWRPIRNREVSLRHFERGLGKLNRAAPTTRGPNRAEDAFFCGVCAAAFHQSGSLAPAAALVDFAFGLRFFPCLPEAALTITAAIGEPTTATTIPFITDLLLRSAALLNV